MHLSRIASIAFRAPFFAISLLLVACNDVFTPVESTPTPNEYEYNYWLLQRTYLFEDELDALEENGESVQKLYRSLKDPYTRYVEPSKSEAAEIAINTTMIPGDVGMTYLINNDVPYPLFVYRVYPNGPAGQAGVPAILLVPFFPQLLYYCHIIYFCYMKCQCRISLPKNSFKTRF